MAGDPIDTRPWNLVVGPALLLTGCAIPASSDDTGTSDTSGTTAQETTTGATTTGATTTDATTDTGPEPECVTSADCPGAQPCINGMCMTYYEEAPPGYCYWDSDCPMFEICDAVADFGKCVPFDADLPPSCPDAVPEIPLTLDVGEALLGLSFVDVDDDGADEIVAATESQLLIYTHGVASPTIVARAQPSPNPVSLVAGNFDPGPGEDLIVFDGTEQRIYAADGFGALAAAGSEPVPIANASSLLVADVDGLAPSDRLIWGLDGALLDRGGGDHVMLWPLEIQDAAVFELGSGHESIVLATWSDNVRYDLDGMQLGVFGMGGGSIVALTSGQDAAFVVTYPHVPWSTMQIWSPDGQAVSEWLFPENPESVEVGDFDGDQRQDIVTPERLWMDPLAENGGCHRALAYDMGAQSYRVHVGDHDGDGDDEFAVSSWKLSEALIFDGE